MEDAGKRKLLQEMGFSCELSYSHKFLYKVELDNQLTEYEWDYVMVGFYDGEVKVNPEEAQSWKFEPLSSIMQDAKKNSGNYTCWFKLILQQPELQTVVSMVKI